MQQAQAGCCCCIGRAEDFASARQLRIISNSPAYAPLVAEASMLADVITL